MFQNFVKLALFSAVQRWFGPRTSGASPGPVHPNFPKIKLLAVHYASLVTLLFLNFLLFVGGLVVTAVATAHSFDVYHQFQASAVFWTGLIMGSTALVIAAFCGWALASTKVTFRELMIIEPEMEPATVTSQMLRPLFEGVLEGLRRPLRTASSFEDNRFDHPAA